MSNGERLSDEQVGQIVGAMEAAQAGYKCKFDEQERKLIHSLAEALGTQGGMDNFRGLLSLGGAFRKAGWMAFGMLVVGAVGALMRVFWLGLMERIRRG